MLDDVEETLKLRFADESSKRSHEEMVAILSAIRDRSIDLDCRLPTIGKFSTICNFQGFRIDLHPDLGEGFYENVLIEKEYLLSFTQCVLHRGGGTTRFQSAPATVIGIRARPEGKTDSQHRLFENDANVIVGSHKEASLHGTKFSPGEELTFLSFHMPVGDGLQGFSMELPRLNSEMKRAEEFLQHEDRHYAHFFASSYATRTLTDILTCRYAGQLRYEYMRLKVLELLCNIEQICEDAEADLSGSIYKFTKFDQRAIEKTRRIIEADYKSKLLEDDIARDVGLSRARLRTFFESKYGQTIHDFIVHLRVNKALELLEHTDMAVNEIAAKVGYSDPSGFRLAFKKIVGVSPRDSRKQYGKF